MRDVLISLKPYYYYLIGENIKKVEVRKSYPKAEDWSRNSWFYMSRDEKSFAKIPKEFQEKYRKHFGKVGMRFVCPKISHWWWSSYDGDFNDGGEYNITDEELKATCLNYSEFETYGDTKILHGLVITDLVVYDEPRELSEFYAEGDCDCMNCKKCYWFDRGNGYNVENDCNLAYKCVELHKSFKPIIRPPQSWCYIEPRQTAD
jgi:hypothetical protein